MLFFTPLSDWESYLNLENTLSDFQHDLIEMYKHVNGLSAVQYQYQEPEGDFKNRLKDFDAMTIPIDDPDILLQTHFITRIKREIIFIKRLLEQKKDDKVPTELVNFVRQFRCFDRIRIPA